jgi:hypothetical protein
MKTPVLRPPVEAVLFGFERIGMVIRIAWLPIVLSVGLYVALFYSLMGGEALGGIDWSAADPSLATDPSIALKSIVAHENFAQFYLLNSLVLPLLVSLILSCVYVATTRASTLADYEPPSLPFYFALGPRELRYFVVRILYAILIVVTGVIFLGLIAGVVAAVAAVTGSIDAETNPLVIAPGAAVAIWLFIVWVWIVMRFLPVLPIAAVENRIAFGDAWKMTKGNFWRLVVSGLFFLALLQGVIFTLILVIFVPAALILGLVGAFAYSFAGAASFAVFALLAVLAVPAFIAIGSFALAAEAAFPARLYAYLSDCGDDCKIY